jgi:hypothetical protein
MDLNIRPRPQKARISPVRRHGRLWWAIHLECWRGLLFPTLAAAMQQFDPE